MENLLLLEDLLLLNDLLRLAHDGGSGEGLADSVELRGRDGEVELLQPERVLAGRKAHVRLLELLDGNLFRAGDLTSDLAPGRGWIGKQLTRS